MLHSNEAQGSDATVKLEGNEEDHSNRRKKEKNHREGGGGTQAMKPKHPIEVGGEPASRSKKHSTLSCFVVASTARRPDTVAATPCVSV